MLIVSRDLVERMTVLCDGLVVQTDTLVIYYNFGFSYAT